MPPNWFLALPVPAGGWFEERVASRAPASVRLFHPSDLHLTIAFLGPVGEAAALRAWELRRLWTAGPVRVGFGPVIGMGPPARFSALSALLERGRAEVEAGMAACRDAMLAAAGAPPDRRPIKAHVTIGRPRREARHTERGAALAWALKLQLAGVEADLSEIALYVREPAAGGRQFRAAQHEALPSIPAAQS